MGGVGTYVESTVYALNKRNQRNYVGYVCLPRTLSTSHMCRLYPCLLYMKTTDCYTILLFDRETSPLPAERVPLGSGCLGAARVTVLVGGVAGRRWTEVVAVPMGGALCPLRPEPPRSDVVLPRGGEALHYKYYPP
jgi:hypothetical protein